MRWSLLAVKLCIVGVYLVLISILLLTVVPLIQGGIDLRLPDSDEVSWSYDQEIFKANVTVGIYNGGVFDIEDCQFNFDTAVRNSSVITNSHSTPVDLKAKQWTDIDLTLVVDTNELGRSLEQDAVFNGTTVNVSVDLSTYVALRMIHFQLGAAQGMSFDIPALISDVQVRVNQARLHQSSNGSVLVLPYSFDASSMISDQTISLQGKLRNASQTLGTTGKNITLHQQNAGELTIPISNGTAQHLLTSSDTLYFDLGLGFQGSKFAQTFTIQWNPPGAVERTPMDWPPLTSASIEPVQDPLGTDTELEAVAKGWSA